MPYITYDNTGTQTGSGPPAGGGSGLTWFNSVGTYWTTSSDTSRHQMAVIIRNGTSSTFDQLTEAFTMPYGGALRQVNFTQNGGTSSSGTVILQRSTNNGSSFADWLTLSGFIAANGNYNNNQISYTQANAATQLNQGDIIIPYLQYSATGVNQSTTCTLYFACPGVT